MVDHMTKEKQALVDELRDLNKVKNAKVAPKFAGHLKSGLGLKLDATAADVKAPSMQKKIKKKCKKQKKTKACENPNAFTDLDLD